MILWKKMSFISYIMLRVSRFTFYFIFYCRRPPPSRSRRRTNEIETKPVKVRWPWDDDPIAFVNSGGKTSSVVPLYCRCRPVETEHLEQVIIFCFSNLRTRQPPVCNRRSFCHPCSVHQKRIGTKEFDYYSCF